MRARAADVKADDPARGGVEAKDLIRPLRVARASPDQLIAISRRMPAL